MKIIIIEIQPKELSNGTLPYPYFINKNDGKIGRQDYWKGNPYRLIGFNDEPKAGDISLSFSQFKENPKLAINKYPVFSSKDDEWVTHTNPIESIDIIIKRQQIIKKQQII